MITSAKNDALKAKNMANQSPSPHRRQLRTTWSVLARLEVLYFPKKGTTKHAIVSALRNLPRI